MPIDYNEFAKKIKAKYPEYKDVDNYTLASKMVEKYPEYKGEVDLKKKDLTVSGSAEPSSARLTTTTTKATVSSSSKVKPDGTYSFPGEDNAIYKKEGGEWFKSFKDENKYYPITKGDVQNRLKSLESNAVLVKPLSTTTTIKPATSSSSRRWDDVTVEPLSKKKYRTDDYIDQVQNAQKKLKTTGQNVESTFEQPKETKPPIKFDGLSDKEAMQMMAEDFGKKEFAAYSSINKMPSANTLKDLDDETSEYSLNKQFEGTNLKFKKIGSQLTVTSKIGYGINSTILNESTIDLSNPNADKELKSFVSTNIVKRSEREQFENAQTVEDLVELVGSNPNKFRSTLLEGVDVEKYFEKERQALNGEMSRANADAYDSDLKLYEQKVAKFNQDVKGGKMSKSDFESRSAELDNERKSLDKRRDIISNVIYKAEKIDKLTSNLEKANVITAAEREKQGSRIGLFFRGAGEGLTDVSQAMIDFGIAGAAAVIDAKTFANAIKPGEYERLKELGFSDDEIKNEIQKSVKNRANKVLRSVPDAIGMGTTEEYAKSSDRGIIDQAIYAVGESFGAVGGGLAAGALGSSGVTAGFFAMSYNALEDQMRGPQFDALSENEKKIMSVPYGLVIGALEKLGARVATGAAKNKTLGMFSEYIMAKTFSSLPKNASLLEIKSAIDKSVAASVANGMLKITGAGIVEGGTEFTQQIFEGVEKDIANRIIQSNQLETAKEEGGGAVSKEIYNQIVQNKFFKDAADLSTTEGIGQLLKESGNAFLVGAVAGGMTSSISVGVAEPISNKVSNNKFAVYRDIILNDDAREGAISSINKKVDDNELTREEADQQIKSINESYPALRQIPTGFSVGAQREAFGLLMERESLNKEIEGKDPNLVAKQKERVADINEQLKGLSYAVQEQATSEVSVQPGAESGGEMAQGESQAGPQEVTKEGSQAQEVNQNKFVAEEATRLAAQENISNEERQSLVDKLYDDPIAYARENNIPGSFSENFLNSLEQQPTAEETAVVEEQASKPITQEQIETKRKETEAKIKRKDLFDGVGAFSSTLGNSDKAAVPFSHRENNGIELVEFAHPDTGSIDVIITGTSENDFVGFYRIYENGKPTNRWSSKFENQSRNKENFKTMIGGVQELLPAGHEYTEKTSISTDGLRVWNQQLDRGYELQYDENGNVVTNEVAINGDAIVNELGIPVNKGKFQNINVTSQAEFQKVKEALLPYLEKLGLNESNIRWMSGPLKDSGTVKIDLPILKKSQPATQKEKATDIVSDISYQNNIITNENINDIIDSQDTATKQKIAKSAKLAMKAIPKAKIYLHNNTAEYDAAVGEQTKGEEKGSFIASDGAIHINMQEAFPHTLLHEAFHYVILNKGLDAATLNGWAKGLRSIVKDKELLNRLDKLTRQYSSEEQSEEFITELGAIIGAAKSTLTTSGFQKFKTLINNIAKKIGLPPIFNAASTRQDAVDFINTISRQLVTGDEINSMGISGVIDATNVTRKKSILATGTFERYPVNPNTKVEENVPLSRFDGKKSNVFESDRMTGAFIADDKGNKLFNFFGGIFYPIITGKWWASNTMTKASGIARNSKRDADGYIYGTPIIMKPGSQMSNNDMLLATLELMKMDALKKNSGVTKAELMIYIEKAFDKKKIAGKKNIIKNALKRSNNIEQIFDELEYTLFQEDGFIKDRNGNDILNDNGQRIKSLTFEERKEFVSGVLGDRKVVSDKFPSAGSMSAMAEKFTEPETQKSKNVHDIVIVYRTKGNLVANKSNKKDPFYHKSYPYEIAAVNQDGSSAEIEVFILDGAYNLSEAIKELTKSSGDTFSYEEYYKKVEQGKYKSEKVALAQYGRTAKLSYASGNIKARKKQLVYNSSPKSVEELGKRSGVVYFATDKREADAYAEMNRGKVREFEIPESDISNEQVVLDKINELGLQPKDPQYSIEESNLYELIDDRFDNSLSQSDIKKLFDALKEDGVTAFRYKDGAQVVEGTTESIAVIDTNVIKNFVVKKQKGLSKAQAINAAKDKYDISVKDRGNTHEQGVESALNDLRKSNWYVESDDIMREEAERELKKFFGEKMKAAPAIKKVMAIKPTKIQVEEMAALKSQIRLEAKAAREAKGDLNTKRKALATAITGMVRQGKITAVQARSIINKVSRVNLDNPVMVDRLISYAERVFDRADYQETLSKAAKIRKSIKKAMKSKDLQAEVAAMAKKFSGVDPFMVEDIDQYIENADKVLNAVRPVRETDVPLRQAADIEAISEYTTAQVERQEANKKAELLALNKYLVEAGVITDDMTAKEIQEMIDIIAAEEYEVENADKKLNFLKNRFEFMSGVIEEMIVNNKDIFTDEALDLTQSQKDLMREVLKFDIDKLSVKQAAQVLEAMDNFINNGITSGLEAVVKGYIGNENANKLAASGLKSRPLRMYWNKAVGKFFGEQFVSLPLLVERMFPGMKKGLKLMSEMGLTDVIRGTAKADREHKMIMKDYTSQEFSKGKGFKKAENVYERGMIAFLSRNLAGTKTEMRNEFLRRVKMVEESINALMTGSETERKMGEAYQKIFDKLKVSNQDLDVIKANAEQMNLDAVNWMTQQWAEKYSDLSDISLSVYNAILGSDTNYTPDRYKGLDESDIKLDEKLLERGSAFMGGLEYTDKNKSGVLIETTRPKVLPKGRFVSLDFDVNNFSSLKGAMIDIETAPAIRQVDGFIKSDGYKRIVNGDDRKILTGRINNYIIKVKGKNAFNRDSMKSVERLANFLGSLGVGKALGGLDQTVKQTAPVIINTLINAGRFDGLNFEMNAAINRSGMPIANRGIEAISGIESIDALIDKKGTTAAEIAKAIEKVSQMYMKALLSKPDVWVARSSFISYYKNYLKTNGMSTDIDWQTHEWNQDAMNYAQMMVDRQQNISDEKLAGSFMNSPDSWKSVTRKVILPFATFIINQKNRMHNDLIALFGIGAETSTEDKKRAARSLVGLSAEMLAYQGIAYFIKTMIYDQIAAYITGEDDEEEEKERSFLGIKMTKKQWNATKFPVKSLVSDVISPFPLLDDAVVFGFDELMSNFPMISKEDIDKAIQDQNDARALKGQDPMDAEQEANLIKNLKDKNTYAVTFQKESLGRQYGVPGIAFDTYTELADMAQLAYTGEFEDDMGFGPKKKYISKKDQELVKWTLLPMVLYSTGLVPKDAGVVSRKVVATVKKRSISETKFNNTNELKTELGRKPKDWEESLVMNTTKKVPTLVEAIKFAERFGGLTESQGKEYAKLIEITGDYGYLDLKRIQEGETADQILKK